MTAQLLAGSYAWHTEDDAWREALVTCDLSARVAYRHAYTAHRAGESFAAGVWLDVAAECDVAPALCLWLAQWGQTNGGPF